MNRSKKWRLEWTFFLGKNVSRQYNKLYKLCVYLCKQSLRAVTASFPSHTIFPFVPKM